MHLKQKNTNEYGSIAGEYEGFYSMSAEHDMSSFKSRPDEVLRYLNGKGALGAGITKYIDAMNKAGFPIDFKPPAPGKTYISRTISGKCEATISESAEIALSLHEDKDETSVDISGITGTLECTIKESDLDARRTLDLELLAGGEKLTVKRSPLSGSGTVDGREFSYSHYAGGQVDVGWDDSIWRSWKDTEKQLKFAD